MIRAQAILHCHPFRFDYSYVAFQLIKAVSQADDCKDLCLLPHPCFPLGCRSNPPCMPSFLPGILFGLHPLPDEQSCGISSSQFFHLFGQACPSSSRWQAAAQAQPVSALCTVDAFSGCHLDLLYVPPSPPQPMLSPCPGGSHTPQHNPWVSLILVQPAPHRWLTQLFTLVIAHHFPNLLLISTKTAHLSPPHMCLLLRGSCRCGPLCNEFLHNHITSLWPRQLNFLIAHRLCSWMWLLWPSGLISSII